MKKQLYTLLTALLLPAASCSFWDKEPDTELTLEMVFNDKTRTMGWLANVYSDIPDPYMGYGRFLGWDVLGDDMTPSERWRQWNWKVIPYILGEWTPNSEWDGNYWASLPHRIREANVFIQNVHALPDLGISNQEVEYMKAECQCMMALLLLVACQYLWGYTVYPWGGLFYRCQCRRFADRASALLYDDRLVQLGIARCSQPPAGTL